MKKSIILISSGLDSLVSLAKSIKETDVKLAITFDYGQRAAKKEIESAKKISDYYSIKHQVINLNWLKEITKTALVDRSKDIPKLEQEDLDNILGVTLQSAQQVWVPNRNAIFINIGAAFAESLDCDFIITGQNAEEGITFPDNTPQFIELINKTLEYSTLRQPKVISYVQNLNKIEIFKLGIDLNVPFKYLWSCYQDTELHCGECESCQRLIRAGKSCNRWDLIKDIFIKK